MIKPSITPNLLSACIILLTVSSSHTLAKHSQHRTYHRRKHTEAIAPEWLCQCKDVPADSLVTYNVTPTLSVVVNYGNKNCSAAPETRCESIEGVHLNNTACAVGSIDIVLPHNYTRTDKYALWWEHRDWAKDAVSVYRKHLCSAGHYLNKPEHLLVDCGPDIIELYRKGEYKVQGSVLHIGADVQARMLQYMTKFVAGDLVGYNLKHPHWRPAQGLVKHPGNYTFVFGDDGTCLPFKDGSFDYVFSINVMEHAIHWQRLLLEKVRVLKPGGIIYMQYHPLWWSPRGHHMGIDMVWEWTRNLMRTGKAEPGCVDHELAYKNDGSVIPDWSHLLWTREHMQLHLEASRFGKCPSIVSAMVSYIYDEWPASELSRIAASDPGDFLTDLGLQQVHSHFETKEMLHPHKPIDHHTLQLLVEKYGHSDFFITAAEYAFVKPAGWTMPEVSRGEGKSAVSGKKAGDHGDKGSKTAADDSEKGGASTAGGGKSENSAGQGDSAGKIAADGGGKSAPEIAAQPAKNAPGNAENAAGEKAGDKGGESAKDQAGEGGNKAAGEPVAAGAKAVGDAGAAQSGKDEDGL